MMLDVTAGQRHESVIAIELLEAGLTRLWFEALAGDRGYSTTAIRDWLAEHEIQAVIPKRENEVGPDTTDNDLYRERNVIERTINRLKRQRAVATRYDKLATSYLAMVTIACIIEWL